MTGMQVLNEQKKDPATPPPEYSIIEQVHEKPPGAANVVVDPVTAAIPLLVSHAEKETFPPDYTERDIESGKDYTRDDDDEGEGDEGDEIDPWKMPELADNGPAWSELDTCGRLRLVLVDYLGRMLALVALLYLFICSLDFLSSGFRLVGGKAAGEAFQSNTLLQNPVAGLMIGILATVLVQSSSTSTSIVVAMVASGIMDVRPAIPIVMGANIGTSVTNTIVSMAQSTDRNQFRRAFAGATVHDMFNWLSVILLLPIEVATGYLYHVTGAMTQVLRTSSGATTGNRDMLKTITKPLTKTVIQLDKKVLEAIAIGNEEYASKSLIKKWCSYEKKVVLVNATYITDPQGNMTFGLENATHLVNKTIKVPVEKCSFLFHDTGLSDGLVGLILLALSLIMLCTCLVLMVKILHSMLRGRIASVIRRTINADFPGPCSYLTGYVAIIVGAGMTILVQSSSVFTSAMTPLVGIGVIEIERMYPLTLGSNIGTTATGVLAALAAPGDRLAPALQISLAHLLFNVSGILLFYPVPKLRLPIRLAKMMGNTTATYRWFAIFYLVVMFFLVPAAVFSLSLWGRGPLLTVLGIVVLLFVVIAVINVLQARRPGVLPPVLRNWEFLPEWMHSLDPLDRLLRKILSLIRRCCPCRCLQPKKPKPTVRTVAVMGPTWAESTPLPIAVELASSATPSPGATPSNSQATSVNSSRSTSLLILPKNTML